MFKQILLLGAIVAGVTSKPYATSYASMTQYHDDHHDYDHDLHNVYDHYEVVPLYAAADYNDHIEQHYDGHYEDHHHPQYTFKYGVENLHTHDIKSQEEHRDGDVVKGHYKLVQPDGRTRVVHYTADKHNGFNADVQYSGHAEHPTYNKYY